MTKLMLLLTVLLSGCAYKGDVFIYSPQGAGNVIEKVSSTDAELNVPLIP